MENHKQNLLYENSTKGPVLYVRHAETEYNLKSLTISKDILKYQPEYIDGRISDRGRKQSEQLSTVLNSFKIKYVFCSPLLRCLETCMISLSTHPNKKDLSVNVNPWLNETVSGVHDFSLNMPWKQESFNCNSNVKFDWTFFNSLYKTDEERETYYFNYIDNLTEDDRQACCLFEKLKSVDKRKDTKENKPIVSDYEMLLAEFSGHFALKKIRPESLKYMFERNKKFKDYLKSFTLNLADDEKILVYTHSAFTKISTSTTACIMDIIPDFPCDCYRLSNCEILTMKIN